MPGGKMLNFPGRQSEMFPIMRHSSSIPSRVQTVSGVRRLLLFLLVCLFLATCSRLDSRWSSSDRNEIRIGFASGPIDLDPHANSEEVTNNICFHIFDPLVFLDRNLKVIPWAANSWQNPNPATWVFHLRPGIRFHDGTPLTSRDVVYSIERIRSLGHSPKKPFVLSIESIQALDDERVEIVTRDPYMPLLIKLSQIMIVPEAYYRRYPAEYVKYHPLGSGPYEPVSIDFNKEITLQAVPGTWRGKPSFHRVRFEFVGDERQRTQQLIDGELDLIKEPSIGLTKELRQSERFEVVQTDGIRLIFIGLTYRSTMKDGSTNPFGNTAVRQAIHLALDRQALCRDTLSNMATPAGQLVPSLVFGYAPGIPPPRYDPARARQILEENHFPFDRTFPAQYPADKYFRIGKTAEACARQLAKIGVKIRPVPVPARRFIPEVEGNVYDVFFCGWSAITGDTSDFFENCFHSRSPDTYYGFFNPVGYHNPEMDALIETSTRLAQRETRLASLQEIMKVCMDEMIWIPLYFLKDSYALRRDLEFTPRVDRYVFLMDLKPRP
jgi:peptide/nickel transport system substrate-binding protein